MPNNSAASYKLVYTAAQLKQLKTWAERAVAPALLAKYLAVLKTVYQKLTTEPLAWGDPWYRLPHLGLQVYQRACTPLHVSYGVDAVRRIVYVRQLTLFSGSGLE